MPGSEVVVAPGAVDEVGGFVVVRPLEPAVELVELVAPELLEELFGLLVVDDEFVDEFVAGGGGVAVLSCATQSAVSELAVSQLSLTGLAVVSDSLLGVALVIWPGRLTAAIVLLLYFEEAKTNTAIATASNTAVIGRRYLVLIFFSLPASDHPDKLEILLTHCKVYFTLLLI